MTWATTVQGKTLVTADNHRERWTRDELEFVAGMTDEEQDAAIATALGRSLYSIWSIQHRLRHDGLEAVLERMQDPAPAPTCPTHHIRLTALGECDWC